MCDVHLLCACLCLGFVFEAFNVLRFVICVRYDLVKLGGGSNTEEYARHTQLKTYPRFKKIMLVLVRLTLPNLVQEFLIAPTSIENA